MTVQLVPIRQLLQLERRAVAVAVDRAYTEIGVRSFGKGLFIKEPTYGADLGDKRLFHVRANDLIVSNVFAWEGAVAVADKRHEGTIGSHRFMTWVPQRESEVNVRYLAHYFASEDGLGQLRQASPGSAGRNRTLSIKNFESIRVPRPHLDEQRRIAAHLDAVASFVASDTSEGRKPKFIRTIQAALTNEMVDAGPLVPLADIADVNPTPCAVGPDDVVGFVPMAAVSDRLGQIGPVETRTKAELTSGYKQFMSGDVIFARITPCMQNGKSAVYRSEQIPIAYGSTEFHVIRAHDPQVTKWLHRVLRSQWFLDQAVRAFTGTAGQQRVPASFLRNAMVPIPRHIAGANMKVAILERLQVEGLLVLERAESLRTSLLPAARNEVFSAMR